MTFSLYAQLTQDMTTIDLTSPREVGLLLDRIELATLRKVQLAVNRLVFVVIEDAIDALSAPSLLAAGGRVKNPFAFTNVMKRWREATHRLAADLDMSQFDVVTLLDDANLPTQLHSDVVDVLKLAKAEGWTDHKTRWHLSKTLIPRRSDKDAWVTSRAAYRASVTRLARSIATRSTNSALLTEFALNGLQGKKWNSRHDSRVRHTHAVANGQVVALNEKFHVGAYLMNAPGDPTAPIIETANCRCVLSGVTTLPEENKAESQ